MYRKIFEKEPGENGGNTTHNAGKDMGQQKLSYIAGGNHKMIQPLWKKSLAVSHKTKHILTIQFFQSHSLIFSQIKNYVHTKSYT